MSVERYDFGIVGPDESVEQAIEITNRGTEPLKATVVPGTPLPPGLTISPPEPSPIPPGEKATLRIVVEGTDLSQTAKSLITIRTNDPARKYRTLIVTGYLNGAPAED